MISDAVWNLAWAEVLVAFPELLGRADFERLVRKLMTETRCGDEAAAKCVRRVVAECQYPPRVAEFMARIPGRLSPKAEAERAWEASMGVAAGTVDPARLSDRARESLRAIGGSSAIERSEMLEATRRAFIDSYLARTEAAAAGVGMPALAPPRSDGVKALPAPEVDPRPEPGDEEQRRRNLDQLRSLTAMIGGPASAPGCEFRRRENLRLARGE